MVGLSDPDVSPHIQLHVCEMVAGGSKSTQAVLGSEGCDRITIARIEVAYAHAFFGDFHLNP